MQIEWSYYFFLFLIIFFFFKITDIILLNETRGVPDSMIVSHLPHGPTTYFNLSNVVMRHDIPDHKHMSEQYPHLIFHKINTKIGKRVYFFNN